MLDFTPIRRSPTCPLCHHDKPTGLIVCWTCYRVYDFRTGPKPGLMTIVTTANELAAITESEDQRR